MAKRIFPYTLFLGFMILSDSCSQDDLGVSRDDMDHGRIEFRSSLPEITTRATEVKSNTLNNFRVSSFFIGTSQPTAYFQYKGFSKNDTGKFISSDPECIWPNNNDMLRFATFAPSCEDMRQAGGFGDEGFILPSLTTGDGMESFDYKLSDFRIASDIASHSDFVTAIGSGRLVENGDGVDLKFRHQLSRIELKVWGTSPIYSIEIAGARLGCVGVGGDFSFTPQTDTSDDSTGASSAGRWTSVTQGNVEYIFRIGDKIVTLDCNSGSHDSYERAAYILRAGSAAEDGAEVHDNSAMLIPYDNTVSQNQGNPDNADGAPSGTYFSVLLRITDTTPYNHGIAYPYPDNTEGMKVIYLAVDAANNVKTQLYRLGDEYFTDAALTQKYDLEGNGAEVKAFGWAAIPVHDRWKPGYVYTYTLNYSDGVGLRDPADPKPGEPIISDRVAVDVRINPWERTEPTDVTVPRK